MALHISRLRIKNFRNFSDCEIEPFPTPAVIVGENGVGKSNLLHALRLVLDPDLPDSARRLRPEDVYEGAAGPFGLGLSGGAEVVIEVELSGFDDDDEALSILSDALVDLRTPKRAQLTYRFSPLERFEIDPEEGELGEAKFPTETTYSPGDYDFQLDQGDNALKDARRVRRFVSVRVLPALRDAEGDLARWNRSPLRTLLEDLDLDPEQLKTVAKEIDVAADTLAKDPEIDDLQKRLADRLRASVGPQLPVNPTVGITSTNPDMLLRSLRLFIDSARTRSVTDTSLGAANILYLGMLLESLAVQRAAKKFATTILGIEEPEAHLHVTVQRRLFRHLLVTEPTMLLTTHSPHITAVAPLNSLLLLRQIGSETVASTTLGADLTELESADISRYLDVSRAELVFARYILLVEGTAETILLPAIANAAGFDLDEYGVVIVNVAGTDFSPYRKLLSPKGLDIPSAVLTDGDPLPQSQKSNEQGLKRAADLLVDDSRRKQVTEKITELTEGVKSENPQVVELRRQLQDVCAIEDIHVGDHTLELDLLPLLGDEMVAAFAELSAEKMSANMARDVIAILATSGYDATLSAATTELAQMANEEPQGRCSDQHRRARVLNRIEAVSKGRFAQRWAAHIAKTDLHAKLLSLRKAFEPEIDEELYADAESTSDERFKGAGTARSWLRGLDWASQQARNRPLLETRALNGD